MLLKKMATMKVNKNEFSERLRMTCSGISVIPAPRQYGFVKVGLTREANVGEGYYSASRCL